MPLAKIEVEGSRDLRRALKEAGRDAADLKATHLAAAQPVLDLAKRIVPEETSNLRDTLRSAGQASGAVVRAGKKAVPYPRFVHFGTKHQSPQPFLYDALDERRAEVIDIYNKRIQEIQKSI